MCRRSAEVGEALALPTPTPVSVVRNLPFRNYDDGGPCSTALDESRPAIELQNAWRESYRASPSWTFVRLASPGMG